MDFSNLRVKDICSVVRYNTNLTHWKAQNRTNHIIGIKLEGSAMHDFGHKEFVLSRNCIYFFNQKEDYTVDVYEQGESFSIHFNTYEEIDTESFCIPLSVPHEFLSILKKAETSYKSKDYLTTLSLLYEFCAKLVHLQKKSYSPTDPRIANAKSYIDMHFNEIDCFEQAISKSGLTARRFGDLFKKIFNITPNKYIIFSRVEYAKALLSTQEISITKVAEMSGFSDVYYFSKTFKSYTGVNPSKWFLNANKTL
jgi:AraC-like DNA-binding protein